MPSRGMLKEIEVDYKSIGRQRQQSRQKEGRSLPQASWLLALLLD